MFDIVTCRDFLAKLNADFDDFLKQQDSARLALIASSPHTTFTNGCGATETDHAVWKQLGIRDRETFIASIERECPGFKTIQDLANGAKHFIRSKTFRRATSAGLAWDRTGSAHMEPVIC